MFGSLLRWFNNANDEEKLKLLTSTPEYGCKLKNPNVQTSIVGKEKNELQSISTNKKPFGPLCPSAVELFQIKLAKLNTQYVEEVNAPEEVTEQKMSVSISR